MSTGGGATGLMRPDTVTSHAAPERKFLDQPVVDPARGTGLSLAPRSEQLLISAANGSHSVTQCAHIVDRDSALLAGRHVMHSGPSVLE